MTIEKLLNKNIDESKQGEVLKISSKEKKGRKLYIESYGCQMNFSDSEIVASILAKEGFTTTKDITIADIVFVNTCSIREKAELTIRKRLEFYNSIKRKKNPNMVVPKKPPVRPEPNKKPLPKERRVQKKTTPPPKKKGRFW